MIFLSFSFEVKSNIYARDSTNVSFFMVISISCFCQTHPPPFFSEYWSLVENISWEFCLDGYKNRVRVLRRNWDDFVSLLCLFSGNKIHFNCSKLSIITIKSFNLKDSEDSKQTFNAETVSWLTKGIFKFITFFLRFLNYSKIEISNWPKIELNVSVKTLIILPIFWFSLPLTIWP